MTFGFEVVGEAAYQEALSTIVGGKCEDGVNAPCTAILIPEPTNRYDSSAVEVRVSAKRVGYLPRAIAADFLAQLNALGIGGVQCACHAKIVGGWLGPNGDEGHFGIKLDLCWPIEREVTVADLGAGI
jgi:hypothetical protein